MDSIFITMNEWKSKIIYYVCSRKSLCSRIREHIY